MMLTSSTFVSAQINVVSPEEAAEVAMFYYCMNSKEETLKIDSYVATPLYDDSDNIIYYCIDFFCEGEGRGYVIIGSNLNYSQCPEIYPEGTSVYYQNAREGKKTIYYNPLQIYTVDEENESIYDIQSQVIAEDEIEGIVYEGDLLENRSVLMTTSNTLDVDEDRITFEKNPKYHLEDLGYTNVIAKGYGTIESTMTTAGAFNYMISSSQLPKTLPGGTVLRNGGHCSITAISNMLLSWGTRGAGKYPDTYEDMFELVLNTAVNKGYFVNTVNGEGVLHSNVPDIMQTINSQFGYNGRVRTSDFADWDFLTNYIDAKWPIYMRFTDHNNPNTYTGDDPKFDHEFEYDQHAVVAFGYNYVHCNDEYDLYEYSFVKVFDGWTYRDGQSRTGKRYISWNMLQQAAFDYEIVGNNTVIDRTISMNMYAFCPYTL